MQKRPESDGLQEQNLLHRRANGGRTGSDPLPSVHQANRPKQPRQAQAAANGVAKGQTADAAPRQADGQPYGQSDSDWRSKVRQFACEC